MIFRLTSELDSDDKKIEHMIFFVSDTHFYHSNIIGYCDRPFISVDQMNIAMIRNWNSVVKKKDTVFHLGDFLIGNKKQTSAIREALNGTIKLIRGNHDDHSNQWYRDCGFDEVYDYPIVFNEFLILSHNPMPFVPSPTMVNLYGHIHNSPMFETWGKQSACMCVERHDYKPVPLEEVAKHFGGVK